ncbi:hypothetical protein GGF50DRAFT_116287 [Schizophyllum commune]
MKMSIGSSPLSSGFSFPRTPVEDGSDSDEFQVLSEDGAMDFTNSAYARKWKKLMALHKDLSDLGASDFSPDLPRITVIGGQLWSTIRTKNSRGAAAAFQVARLIIFKF